MMDSENGNAIFSFNKYVNDTLMKGHVGDTMKENDNMVKVETDVVVEDDEKCGLGNLLTKHIENYLRD